MQSADQDLLAQWLQERDAEAFREVALRYTGMVYGVCRRILHNATDAEDAAQETFVKLAALEKASVNLGPWLHRVAVNCSLVHLRSERRRVRREQAFASAAHIHDEAPPDDLLAHLDEAVASLPARLREPLVCHFYNGETHEAIAAKTGLSRQAVGYRIQKAVAKVRTEMKKKGVVVAVGAVAGVLKQDLAGAAPANLTTYIGKLAVVGHAAAGPALAGAGMALIKVAKVAVALVLIGAAAVLGLKTYSRQPTNLPKAAPQPALVQTEAAPAVGAAVFEATASPPAAAAAAPLLEVRDDEAGDATQLISVFFSNGEPAAGAEVRLSRLPDPRVPGAPLRVRKGKTDAEGNVLFSRVPPGGIVTARAVENGVPVFGVIFEPGGSWDAHYARRQVVLYQVATTTGTVVDEAGAPVAGAVVYPKRMALSPGLLKELAHRVEKESVETDIPGYSRIMAVTTDAAGRFSFAMWPGTLFEYLVIKPGYKVQQTATVAVGEDVQVVLTRGTEVCGAVTIAETGVAVAGAVIRVEKKDDSLDHRFAETDAQGRFTVAGLGPGKHHIALVHPEYVLHPDDWEFLVAHEDVMDLVYSALKAGSVSGRVVDADTGEAMRDVRVHCHVEFISQTTLTDAEGRFSFSGLAGTVHVMAQPDDTYVDPDARMDVEVLPGQETAGLVIECKRRDLGLIAWLSGRTVDEKGNPVPHAYVRAHDFMKQYSESTISDAHGGFRFEEVPVTGDLMLYAEIPGMASGGEKKLTVEAAGLENVEVVLKPTGTISGTVVDVNGKPYGAVDWEIDSQHTAHFFRVPVMPNGQFKLVDVAAGQHRLYIETESRLKVFFSRSHVMYTGIRMPGAVVQLEPGQNLTDVKVASHENADRLRTETGIAEPELRGRPWTVKGAVLGPDGAPLNEFRYCSMPMDYEPDGALGPSGGVRTSEGRAGGEWSWQGEDPGVSITFKAKGCMSLTREFVRDAGGAATQIRMQAGCVVEGRVIDENGAPVAGAEVHIGQVHDDTYLFATERVHSDAEGNYRVDTLAPEPIELFAKHPSFARGSITVSPVHARTTRADIILTQGGAFEGHVYQAGKPVPGAYVQYRQGIGETPADYASTSSDENGFYRMQHVPPGPLEVSFWLPGRERHAEINRQIEVQQGRVEQVDVHFVTFDASAEGAVTLNGNPAPSVDVRYKSLSGDVTQIFTMGESQDACYKTGPLPAGEGLLTVMTSANGQTLRKQLRVSLVNGRTTRLDVEFQGTASIGGAVNGLVMLMLYEGSSLPTDEMAFAVATTVPDQGQYVIEHLPAGTYTLYAGKHPVSAENGLVTVVTLEEGEHRTVDLDVSGFAG